MFCKYCGTQNDDNATSCKNCGKSLTLPSNSNSNTTSAQANGDKPATPPTADQSSENSIRKKISFISPDEKPVASLGSGYINNLLKEGSLSKNFCVVSDKKVYYKGRIFTFGNKAMSKYLVESIVDLKDVTGSSFIQKNPIMLLILGIISLILTLVFFSGYGNSDFMAHATVVAFFLGIILIVLYNIMKVKLFLIEYSGGDIVFKANDYSYSEIVEFQKSLRIAVDKRNEEIYKAIQGTKESYQSVEEQVLEK